MPGVSWTQSIAKRSGTRTVPSIDSVAPRWALIGSQHPFPATQRGPRSGGAIRIARPVATRVGTPTKLKRCSGSGGWLSVIVSACASRRGRGAPAG